MSIERSPSSNTEEEGEWKGEEDGEWKGEEEGVEGRGGGSGRVRRRE